MSPDPGEQGCTFHLCRDAVSTCRSCGKPVCDACPGTTAWSPECYACLTSRTWALGPVVGLGWDALLVVSWLEWAVVTASWSAGVIGVATLAWAWRHARIRPLATETSEELTRVTWPSWQETKMNAWTTVVVSVLVAIILGVMDMVFGNLTNFILGGAA